MAAESLLQISQAFQKHLLIYYPFTLATMFFLYGFYILLFGMAFYLLRRRQSQMKQTKFYLASIVSLFAITTVMIISTTLLKYYSAMVDFELIDEDSTVNIINTCYGLYNLLPPLANIIADAILIHRCYVIWSSRKRVAFPLIILSIATNVTYLVGVVMVFVSEINPTLGGQSSSFYINGQITLGAAQVMSAIVNMILTLLTAGRIWWVHRQAQRRGIQASDDILQSIIRIILESGILYPIIIIIGLIIENTLLLVPLDLLPVVTLFAGIAPTLVVVRTRFGKPTNDTQTIVSNMRFGTQTGTERVTTLSQIQTLQLGDDDPEKIASTP